MTGLSQVGRVWEGGLGDPFHQREVCKGGRALNEIFATLENEWINLDKYLTVW